MPKSANAKTPLNRKAKTEHGILVLHGAGVSEDEKRLIGDPLSTIANGLVDVSVRSDLETFGQRIALKAKTENHNLSALEVDFFGGAQNIKAAHVLQMRELRWRPTTLKGSILDFIPLLWLWALVFQSHITRKEKAEKLERDVKSGAVAMAAVERETDKQRHLGDFITRFVIAVLGFGCMVGEVYFIKWLVSQIRFDIPGFLGDIVRLGVARAIISISAFSAILLVLLALEELNDRGRNKPSGNLHLTAMVLTTAWLAGPMLPVLFIAYYFDRVVTFLVVTAIAAIGLIVPLMLGFGWPAIIFLLAFALSIWLVTRNMYEQKFASPIAQHVRENLHIELARWITILIVVAGAPLLIAIILALEVLSLLPFVGESINGLAQKLSDVSNWTGLKDIYTFLTDSSRSAEVRSFVEQGIVDLAGECKQVHIFAHSLGTAVAYDALVQIGRGEGVLIKKGDAVYNQIKTLVTYGCPLNKIRMLAIKTREMHQIMTGFDYTRFDYGAHLASDFGGGDFCWLNFYSTQDFVSDALTLFSRNEDCVRPKNFVLESANDIRTAHGAYWTDTGFWAASLRGIGLIEQRARCA